MTAEPAGSQLAQIAQTRGLYDEVEKLHPHEDEYLPCVTVAVARQDEPDGYEPVSEYSVLEQLEKYRPATQRRRRRSVSNHTGPVSWLDYAETASLSGVGAARNRWKPPGSGDDWRATGARQSPSRRRSPRGPVIVRSSRRVEV